VKLCLVIVARGVVKTPFARFIKGGPRSSYFWMLRKMQVKQLERLHVCEVVSNRLFGDQKIKESKRNFRSGVA